MSRDLVDRAMARGWLLGAFGPEVASELEPGALAVAFEFLRVGPQSVFTAAVLASRLGITVQAVQASLYALTARGVVSADASEGGPVPAYRLLTPQRQDTAYLEARGWLRGKGGTYLLMRCTSLDLAILAVLLRETGRRFLAAGEISAALHPNARPSNPELLEGALRSLMVSQLVELDLTGAGLPVYRIVEA